MSLHAAPVPIILQLSAPAAAGFAYGFINSAYLHQGLFLVVTSYILHSDKDILSELEKIGATLACHLAGLLQCHVRNTPLHSCCPASTVARALLHDSIKCAAGKLEGLWSNVDSELYKLAIYGGYVAAGFFIAQFVFLILFAEAVKHFETRRPHPRGASCVLGMQAGCACATTHLVCHAQMSSTSSCFPLGPLRTAGSSLNMKPQLEHD